MKVLYIAAECKPFFKAGGVGDVVGELPWALKKKGVDVEVVIPYYGSIGDNSVKFKTLDYRFLFNGRDEHVEIYQTLHDSVPINFIKNSSYFEGHYSSIYVNSPNIPYYDDALRFSFFSEACLHLISKKNPQIVHINDWVLGYLSGRMEMLNMKQARVLTIHNIVYQGNMGEDVIAQWDMAYMLKHSRVGPQFRDPNAKLSSVNPLALAISTAHKLNTVSPNYCREICMPESAQQLFPGGKGLEGLCKKRFQYGDLVGILNGFNYQGEPGENHFQELLKQKKKMKSLLVKDFKKTVKVLLGFVGRAVEQKLELLTLKFKGKSVLDHILDIPGVAAAFLATGEEKYEDFLRSYSHRDNCSVTIAFDKEKAKTISLGCDLFLMPSLFEPCGIAQMDSMQNATPALVRHTGGLADTVIPHTKKHGTGFVFEGGNEEEVLKNLINTVKTAMEFFSHNPKEFQELQRRAYEQRFLWSRAAEDYITRLYAPLAL